MHVYFNPEDYNLWLQYYSSQAAQTGYGIEGFQGLPYQRGAGLGSFFRSLFRWAMPVLKSAGQQIGKHALKAGANIATDLAKGHSFVESAKQHAREEGSKLFKTAGEALHTAEEAKANGLPNGRPNGRSNGGPNGSLEGHGLGFRPKSINTKFNDLFTKQRKRRRNGVS